MIVVMKPGASEECIQHVIDLVHDYGLKDHPIYGTDRTVIACIGDKRDVDKGAIENAPMVEKIVPILAPYKRASLEVKKERTEIAVGPNKFPIGGNKIGIMAGPCAVESTEQILTTAKAIKDAGFTFAILTATHETGFALFQSDVNPYSMKALKFQDGKGIGRQNTEYNLADRDQARLNKAINQEASKT